MITAENKQIVINILGRNYSQKILPELKKNNIVSPSGADYNNRTLQWLVNGGTENIEAEKVIFDLIKKIKKNRDNLTKYKQSV